MTLRSAVLCLVWDTVYQRDLIIDAILNANLFINQRMPPTRFAPVEGLLGVRYRHNVGALGEHVAHEHCPDALHCLPDTEGPPQYSLPIIIRCAILGSPKGRITVSGIYAAMEEKYPYYRTAGQSWKVRSSLRSPYTS